MSNTMIDLGKQYLKAMSDFNTTHTHTNAIDGKKESSINETVSFNDTYTINLSRWDIDNVKLDNMIGQYFNDNNDTVLVFKKTRTTKSHATKSHIEYEKKSYLTIDDFISNEYINLCKCLVWIKATKNNVKACWDILNKGYENDSMFFDLCQETALFLYENKNKITCTKDYHYTLDNCFIDLLRHLDNYLYKNKTRVENIEIAITDYNGEKDTFSTIAINSKEYRQAIAKKIKDSTIADRMNYKLNETVATVQAYLWATQKKKLAEKLCAYIELLLLGVAKKDICKELDISSTTATKYHNMIKNAYYEKYVKYIGWDEEITPLETTKNETIKVDFTTCLDYGDKDLQVGYMPINSTTHRITPLEQAIACIENYIYNGNYCNDTLDIINDLMR